jgi:hypothetical protein
VPFGGYPDGEIGGAVLERRLELIAHGGLEVVLAGLGKLTPSWDFGRAVCEVGEYVGVDASGVT